MADGPWSKVTALWCHAKCHFVDCLPKCDYCDSVLLRVKAWFVKKSQHPGMLRKRLQSAPWKNRAKRCKGDWAKIPAKRAGHLAIASEASECISFKGHFYKRLTRLQASISLNLLGVAISVDENNLSIWDRVWQSLGNSSIPFNSTQLTQVCFSIVAWILALSVWSVPQQQHLNGRAVFRWDALDHSEATAKTCVFGDIPNAALGSSKTAKTHLTSESNAI